MANTLRARIIYTLMHSAFQWDTCLFNGYVVCWDVNAFVRHSDQIKYVFFCFHLSTWISLLIAVCAIHNQTNLRKAHTIRGIWSERPSCCGTETDISYPPRDFRRPCRMLHSCTASAETVGICFQHWALCLQYWTYCVLNSLNRRLVTDTEWKLILALDPTRITRSTFQQDRVWSSDRPQAYNLLTVASVRYVFYFRSCTMFEYWTKYVTYRLY